MDLALPHLPDFAFRRGMEVDALMFEAHKEEYKEKLRKKILTQREETLKLIQAM